MNYNFKENTIKLFKRQDNRYKSVCRKIENILDFTRMYQQVNNFLKVQDILDKIKDTTKSISVIKDGKKNEYRYIDIVTSYDIFAQGIYDELYPIIDDIVCRELYDFEDNIKQYLDYAPDSKKKELNKNIRELTGYVSISKNKQMSNDLLNIKNDLLACLKYNNKIKNEEKYEQKI